MKRIVVLLVTLFIFSCEKNDPENPTFNFGQNMLFAYEVTYDALGDDMHITAALMNDSRCPANADCIWQGSAVVAIALETDRLHLLELNTYDNPADTVDNISIELVSVEPYPVLGDDVELSDKEITLKVERIN